jgi:ABC-type Zn2+ transport system substrate-binding protein/surface adhesin
LFSFNIVLRHIIEIDTVVCNDSLIDKDEEEEKPSDETEHLVEDAVEDDPNVTNVDETVPLFHFFGHISIFVWISMTTYTHAATTLPFITLRVNFCRIKLFIILFSFNIDAIINLLPEEINIKNNQSDTEEDNEKDVEDNEKDEEDNEKDEEEEKPSDETEHLVEDAVKALYTYNRYIKNQCKTYIIDIILTLTSFVHYFYSNILHRINRIIKY